MERFLEFFKNNKAQEQIDSHVKKYKNKKIVLYGAGLYASALMKNYDLSKLNIIGIADKRFGLDDSSETFCNYKTIAPNDLIGMDLDVILISVQEYYGMKDIIKENILNRRKDTKIILNPIIQKSVYKISGENNRIIIVENDKERPLGYDEYIEGMDISIKGNNNLIKIEYPCIFHEAKIEITNSNKAQIIIHNTSEFWWYVKAVNGENQYFEFGKDSTVAYKGFVHILNSNAGVRIGKDCMFSGDIVIFASDAHRILDKDTKKILNNVNGYVEIGNHCWIAHGAKLLKNARIKDNCIVGAGAVVSKAFSEENIAIAGNPAKIVKRNIAWLR